MITAIPENNLGRITEKRSEEISPLYLENFENGYYNEDEDAQIFYCAKGRIPAAQAEAHKKPAVFESAGYRVVEMPIGNVVGGGTEPILFLGYSKDSFEKAVPAAFPASLWMPDVLISAENGRRDRAFKYIFDEMDKLLRNGDFEVCNRRLETLDVQNLSPDLLVAFLTITLPAHEHLLARPAFYARVEKRLADEPDKDKLLSGLKEPKVYEPRFY
jgi:hypothetical protein